MGYVQRVASGAGAANTLTHNVAVTATTTVGNRVILAVKSPSSSTVASVTDSRGNTWTINKTTSLSNATIVSTVMTTALQSGDTITITLTVTSNSVTWAAYEYADAVSVDATGANTGSGLSGSAPVTTTMTDEIIVAIVGVGQPESTVSIAGWTIRDSGQVGSARGALQFAELVAATPGVQTAAWSWTAASAGFGIAVVAFKTSTSAAGGGGSGRAGAAILFSVAQR